jgi:hypothetical protein
MKIPTNNEAARKTSTSLKIMHKEGNKILILKETRTKQTTLPHAHTQCKHMATDMDQYQTIHKVEITISNGKKNTKNIKKIPNSNSNNKHNKQ